MDDKLRPLYDQRLRDFKTKKPKRVTNSYPAPNQIFMFLDDDVDRVDVDYLLKGEQLDVRVLEEKARLITQYKSEELERAKKLYDKVSEDPDFTALYREALERKISYLATMERYLWTAAGVQGENYITPQTTVMDTALIGEVLAEHIEHVRDEIIPKHVEQRSGLLALGVDKNPILLLTYEGSDSPKPQHASEEVNAAAKLAQSRFEELSKAITENAKERAEATRALLDLSPLEMLHDASPGQVIIHLIKNSTGKSEIEKGTVVLTITYIDIPGGNINTDASHDFIGKTLSDLRTLPMQETTFAVLLNPHLNEPMLDFGNAYRRVLEQKGIKGEFGVNILRAETEEQPTPSQVDRPAFEPPSPGLDKSTPK